MVTLDGSAMGFDYSAFLSTATNNATLTTAGLLDTSAVKRALASDCGPDGNGTTCLNIFGGQVLILFIKEKDFGLAQVQLLRKWLTP